MPVHARLADVDVGTTLQQFGLGGFLLMALSSVQVLFFAVSIAKGEDWTVRRRQVFRTCAAVLGLTPFALASLAIVFPSRGAPETVSEWSLAPIPFALVVQVIAAAGFVSAARGIRSAAGAALVLPVITTLYVAFVSTCIIGGVGP